MNKYTLKTQDLEIMLQKEYGNKIEPVDPSKLLQLKRQQERAKNSALIFKKSK